MIMTLHVYGSKSRLKSHHSFSWDSFHTTPSPQFWIVVTYLYIRCLRIPPVSLFFLFCTGNSTLAGEANRDWREEEGVAASAKQNFRPHSTNDGCTLSCKKIIHNIECIVPYIKNRKKMNHRNDIWPANISFSFMHPVGVKAQKHFLSQQIHSMRPCVEVRGEWFRDRAVQPSATIMSWVNHTHYALSGTTCWDFVSSGGCIQGILRA